MKKKIIFISGWGFKADIFDDVAEHMDVYENYFVDLPALEIDSRLRGNDTTRDDAILGDTILVGWSLGGLAALQAYNNFPESFSHLILIASTPRFMRAGNWTGISDVQADKQLSHARVDMQNYQQNFLRLAMHPDKETDSKQAMRDYMHPHDKANLFEELQTLFYTDMRSEFSKLTIPVMQIIAENDFVVRPEQSIQSKQLLNHTIHTIPKAGHMLLKTHTQEVATRIKEFIC